MKRIIRSQEGLALVQLVFLMMFVSIVLLGLFLIINPVQMMKKGRDSQRETDLKNLRSAIEAYMKSDIHPQYIPGFNPKLPSPPLKPPFIPLDQISNCVAPVNCCTVGDVKHSGWLAPIDPDDATKCPSGPSYPTWAVDLSAYISKIPLDPTNNATYHYRYQSDLGGTKFSLTAKYEDNPSSVRCFQTGTFTPESYCWGP